MDKSDEDKSDGFHSSQERDLISQFFGDNESSKFVPLHDADISSYIEETQFNTTAVLSNVPAQDALVDLHSSLLPPVVSSSLPKAISSVAPSSSPLPRVISSVAPSSSPLPRAISSVAPSSSPLPRVISSVAPSSSLNKPYNNAENCLDIYFEAHKKDLKGVTWIFSPQSNKLFVAKDALCPIKFFVTNKEINGAFLRVQTFFSQAQHSQENVRRCINHSMEDEKSGLDYPDHLIRCENPQAKYETSETGHHSVLVPFEISLVDYTTYVFKFMCYSSCTGGLNRRSVAVTFTLENDGNILGRKSVDVKICACPGRDYRREMKRRLETVKESPKQQETKSAKKRKLVEENVQSWSSHFSEIYNFIEKFKKIGKKENENGPFTITVDNHEEYVTMASFYFCYKAHKNPNVRQYLKSLKSVKKEDSTNDSESQ